MKIEEKAIIEEFDGVNPIEYPQVYTRLLTMHCFKKRANIKEFYIDIAYGITLCNNCFEQGHYNQSSVVWKYSEWHNIYIGALIRPTCYFCKSTIIERQSAIDCSTCTDKLIPN